MGGYYLAEHPTRIQQHNTTRRDNTKPSGLIVVHTAEGGTSLSGEDKMAESVARYTATRTTHGSYHVIVDADSTVEMAAPEWEAFHCRFTNRYSYGICAAVNAADWRALRAVAQDGWTRERAILDRLARATAKYIEWMRDVHGIEVPVLRVSRSDALAGKPGLIGHGETDPGRRSDPGTDFDWSWFLTQTKHYLGQIRVKENTMATMANPARGRVSSEYGWRGAISATIPRMLHAGIDIANKVGTPVVAAFAGTVEKAGWNVVAGRTGIGVLIRNPDGEAQYYGHLNKAQVKVGQDVPMGGRIGTMGATGNVTGPHLHFEVWNTKNVPMNPRVAFGSHKVTPGKNNVAPAPVVKPKPKPKPKPSGEGNRVHRNYYTRAVDGVPGPYTIRALQEFLRDRGLYGRVVDGQLGTYTWRGVQLYLTIDNFYTRVVDGVPGPYTIRAMQTWLTRAGRYDRAIDGQLGAYTWRALQSFLTVKRWVTIK